MKKLIRSLAGYDFYPNKITDPEGIVSEMSYTTGDLVNAFTTPYGTWTIEWGTVPSQFNHVDSLFVQVTDPYGDRERGNYSTGQP